MHVCVDIYMQMCVCIRIYEYACVVFVCDQSWRGLRAAADRLHVLQLAAAARLQLKGKTKEKAIASTRALHTLRIWAGVMNLVYVHYTTM
jgi:hypothetical protein